MANKCTIDLDKYVPRNVYSLDTQSWGIVLRNKCKIEERGKEADKVEIFFPEYLTSISTSFLEEFLGVAILEHKDNFTKKFTLTTYGQYKIQPYLHEAMNRILQKELVCG